MVEETSTEVEPEQGASEVTETPSEEGTPEVGCVVEVQPDPTPEG